MCVNNTHIEELQWCTTAQHFAAPDKYSFGSKSIILFYERGVIPSSKFSPVRIILRGESRVITEKNTSSFLLCPTLMSSVPQKPSPSVWYSERDTQEWTPSIRDELLEVYVRLFRSTVLPDIMSMGNNAKPHKIPNVDGFLEEEDVPIWIDPQGLQTSNLLNMFGMG